MINTIIRKLDWAAERFPDRTAISTPDNTVTFDSYRTEARRIGAELLFTVKGYNEPVAVFLPKSEKALFCFMGILYSGNYYVPLDYESPVQRIEKIVKQLGYPCLLTDRAGKEKLEGIVPDGKLICIEDIPVPEQKDIIRLGDRMDLIIDTDPVYVIFTSGSTGDPKGVIVPHRAVIDIMEWWTGAFAMNEETVFANQAPFHFDLSVPDIFTPLFTGGRIHLLDSMLFMNPVGLVKEINNAGVNALNWSPSAMMMLSYTKVFKKAAFERLEKVMFIGEPMPVKHLNYWMENCKDTVFVNLYGPTEAAYASTYYIIDRKFDDDDILPIGKACANERVFLLSEDKQIVSEPLETGEICISGSCLAAGYYRQDSEAFDILYDMFSTPVRIYRTGDIGRYNERGEMECLGRMDSQIKHMGYRIDLGEIEVSAAAIPGVRNACVLYHREKKEIHLFYEADERIGREEILEALRGKLPRYMLPSGLTRLDRMPLNRNGKTDRAGLRDSYLT